MGETIAEITKFGKKSAEALAGKAGSRVDLLFICVLFLTGITSFGLGRLSAPQQGGVVIDINEELLAVPSVIAEESEQTKRVNTVQTEGQTVDVAPQTTQAAAVAPTSAGQFVASKSGSAYHFPWCSGAQRIKPENLVYFASKEAAEAVGYQPAKNCPGL